MQHLKALLMGAVGLFGATVPRNYPTNGGFTQDFSNLRGDWKRTGDDLRSALKTEAQERKRGKSPDAR